MRVREPAVAGRFYPAAADQCRLEVVQLVEQARADMEVGNTVYGGLVPHAGWAFSGAVAGGVLDALRRRCSPKSIVLFGSVHRHRGREAAMFASGRWETPLGHIEIDARLAERILGHTSLILDDPYAHEDEHSIEVQLPLIKHLFPEAKIVPIMVPAVAGAPEVGDAVARTLKAYQYDALIVGTTDLTHYGPSYGFTPHGVGAEANRWAKEQNDVRFIELVCSMRHKDIVAEAQEHRSACGSGATAATVAAVSAIGASRGILLDHTTSSEVRPGASGREPHDSVGYCGIVFA